MRSAKREVEALLARLPDDVTLEEIRYHVHILAKIEAGLRSAETEPMLTQAEAEARLARPPHR
jgi:hypothetical protein